MKKLGKGLLVLSIGLILAGCSCNDSNTQEQIQIESGYDVNHVYDDVSTNFEALYNEAVQSTVSVIANGQLGSGVVYKEEGNTAYILTNAHVLIDVSGNDYTNKDSVDILFSNYVRVEGKKVYLDKNEDVAIIRVDKSDNYKVAKIVASDTDVSVGETVFAIGTPRGNYFSVTTGVVSANRLEATTDYISGTSATKTFVYNTTATINPGNSGGALFNSNGELIAINTMQPSDTATSRNFNYSIPINYFIKVADYLMTNNTSSYQKPKLNLEVKSICDYSTSELNTLSISVKNGVYVTSSTETDLARGRVITHVNGNKISTSLDYYFELLKYSKGDTVTLTTSDIYGNNVRQVNLIMK